MSTTDPALTITTAQIDDVMGIDDNARELWLAEIAGRDDAAVATLVNEDGVAETVLDASGDTVTVADLRDRYLAS